MTRKYLTMLAVTICLAVASLLSAQSGLWKPESGWSAREGHTSAVFNNRTLVIGGKLVDGTLTREVWSSANAADWVLETASPGWTAREQHASVVFNNRIWVLGGSVAGGTCLNDVWSSADGINWNLETSAAAWSARAEHTVSVYNGELWLLGGREMGYWADLNDVWTSSDGINWTQAANAPWSARSGHAAVVYNNELFVVGGLGGFYYLNDVWGYDGTNWALKTSTAFPNGTWGPRTGTTALVHNSLMWVIGGINGLGSLATQHSNGEVYSSPDGITWTLVTGGYGWADRTEHTAVVFNDRLTVLGGLARMWSGGIYGGGAPGEAVADVWSSANGMIWTRDTASGGFDAWSGRARHTSLAFNNRMWVLGGSHRTTTGLLTQRHDVWSSLDGVNWVEATPAANWAARTGHTSVTFNSRMWVLGGADAGGTLKFNDVWSSTDGISWVQSSTTGSMWGIRDGHASVVYDNRMWVIGGFNGYACLGDVWSSPDGINWTRETQQAGWSARAGHTATVFDNRMWVMGGTDGTTDSNDVWSSTDGITWVQETAAAGWLARYAHSAVTAHGRLWVAGGTRTASNGWAVKDLWSSTDGTNWVQESNPLWPARAEHTLLAFDTKLWMLGGRYATGMMYGVHFPVSEAWSLTIAPQIISTPVTSATAGSAYSYDVLSAGSTAIVSATGLPSWLTLSGSVLSGTPGASDIGTSGIITVTATNDAGFDSQSFQISVAGVPPMLVSTPPTTATAGVPYSYAVASTGGIPAPVFSATGLPAWLQLDAVTGVLAGTPGGADIGLSGLITIVASNGTAPDAQQSFQIDVAGTPARIISMPVTTGVAGQTYQYQLVVQGLPAATLSSNTLPAWLALDASNGLLSGIPLPGETGTVNVVITADNGWGTDTQTFDIVILESAPSGGGSEAGEGCTANGGRAAQWWLLLAVAALIVLGGRVYRRSASRR